MRFTAGTWLWAWGVFADWSRLDLDPTSLTIRERWRVVAATITTVMRARYSRPAFRWAGAHLPVWWVLWRLRRAPGGWHRIPNPRAAHLAALRFDLYPIEVGEHLRVERGRVLAIAYNEPTWCEIVYFMDDGQPEPQPSVPAMGRAWAAYWDAVRG